MLELTKNRIAAMGLAACLLVYAGSQIGVGQYFVWRIGGYVGFSLGLIWFGPALGEYTGFHIRETTPGIAVIGLGWLLLLLTPLVIYSAKARMAMGF